ncbi:MAG TPA: amidohydrolase family protein [Acidimicrobiia bacterium]
MAYDLVVRGGTVVDGTGAPAFSADVAVDGGTIVEVGRVTDRARHTIHADGLLITPGFVDVHTHYDGQATWDPHLTPSCWQGVTTAILGNCGVGFAPARSGEDAHVQLVELMEGVEDIPGTALYEGIQWEWETFPEYLDALERMPRAIDVGAHVPHAALRAYVMGERAQRDATADDIEAMGAIVRDAIAHGALGFSTGRTRGHRDVRGRPVPGTFAAVEELDALSTAMSRAGRAVFQAVPAGIGGVEGGDPEGAMDDELRWLLDLAARTHNPITFLVMESRLAPDAWRPWFEAARHANDAGANLRPQVGSRCFGALLGHQSRMNPLRYAPTYERLKALPFDEMVARLHEPSTRAAILAEAPESNRASTSLDRVNLRVFPDLYPLGDDLDYEPSADRSIAAIAERARRDPWDVLYDVMLEAGGTRFVLRPFLNYGRGSYDGLYDMMRDPLTVQGLGDGGAHSSIICDASMTTYLLTHWVRHRTRGPRLALEHAIRRLTKDGADLYGLGDRGAIEPGRRADLNLVDLDRLQLRYPERVTDLPGGAGRLVQRADGYVATLVAGEVVVDNGELTDARPGTLVRGPRASM